MQNLPTQKTPLAALWSRKNLIVAAISVVGIVLHLALRFGFHVKPNLAQIPLLFVLTLGGAPLVFELLQKLLKREFGSDLLAGISIVTSLLLGEYLAGAIVVLMLSGGEALENYALRKRLFGAGRARQTNAFGGASQARCRALPISRWTRSRSATRS